MIHISMLMLKNKLFFLLNSSYFKFGLLVGATYLVELIIFYFLTLSITIFYANFISSIIGATIDYFFAISKKLRIFSHYKRNKLLIYFIYLLFIFFLISFNSFLIKYINYLIQLPVLSKIIVIPLSYTIHWSFFYLIFEKKIVYFANFK